MDRLVLFIFFRILMRIIGLVSRHPRKKFLSKIAVNHGFYPLNAVSLKRLRFTAVSSMQTTVFCIVISRDFINRGVLYLDYPRKKFFSKIAVSRVAPWKHHGKSRIFLIAFMTNRGIKWCGETQFYIARWSWEWPRYRAMS